jgi:putative FmdB family regulatory protein
MKIFDFECQDCGNIHEVFMTHDFDTVPCPVCGGMAKKIFTPRQTQSVDAAWIASMREVVDKKSNKPHCKEFLRHPTRANYKAWLKGEGLRHMDKAEPAMKKWDEKAWTAKTKDKLIKAFRRREAIEI